MPALASVPTRSRNDVFQADWVTNPPPRSSSLAPRRAPSAPATPPPEQTGMLGMAVGPQAWPHDRPDSRTRTASAFPPSFIFHTPASFQATIDTSSPPIDAPKTAAFFGEPSAPSTPSRTPSKPSSKTSSFFSTPTSAKPPARLAPPVTLESQVTPTRRAPPPDVTPLHQSPSLAPAWAPPHPPADDIALRLIPEPGYLLGEGRYAAVYLAAYRRELALDADGDEWRLCAAKRPSADREAQTMALREAFFLNRLATGPDAPGRVCVVKLIAVKEDVATGNHGRSTSDQNGLERRSTIYAGTRSDHSHPNLPSLADSPKGRQPGSLGRTSGAAMVPPSPSTSRLVLILEPAPLTMDRVLRSSPTLVGEELWGRWARETAEALRWVHSRGVVHADVKPGNLLLTTDLHIRLSDFGSSLLIHPSHPPTDGVGLGTLPFSPPELVDPSAPFSFPVDIFALGATLYQCITGREPYRGARPVEMMTQVRKGGLWGWSERDRLHRIGDESSAPSPYPSAWRGEPVPAEAPVRRAGSLRLPPNQWNRSHGPAEPSTPPRPRARLVRVGSAESFKASEDTARAHDSPAGVRLLASYARNARQGRIDRLLDPDGPGPSGPPTAPVSRSSSLRSPSSPLRRMGADSPSPTSPLRSLVPDAGEERAYAPAYADGAPAMFFLAGGRVPDAVRDVLRTMLSVDAAARPSAADVVRAWDALGVGVEYDV